MDYKLTHIGEGILAQNLKEQGLMSKLGNRQVVPPWGVGEALLSLAVLLVGMIVIGTAITATVASNPNNPEPTAFVLGWLIGLAIVFVFVLVRWRREKARFDALKLSSTGYWHPLLAVLVGVGGAFTAALVAGIFSTDFLAPIQVARITDNNIGTLALVALWVVIAQPLGEGLVFWGVLQPRLRASLGALPGLFATIAIFTMFYYLVFGSQVTGNIVLWYGVVYPLIVGFTLGAVRVWSQSTLATILAQVGVGMSIIVTMLVV